MCFSTKSAGRESETERQRRELVKSGNPFLKNNQTSSSSGSSFSPAAACCFTCQFVHTPFPLFFPFLFFSFLSIRLIFSAVSHFSSLSLSLSVCLSIENKYLQYRKKKFPARSKFCRRRLCKYGSQRERERKAFYLLARYNAATCKVW